MNSFSLGFTIAARTRNLAERILNPMIHGTSTAGRIFGNFAKGIKEGATCRKLPAPEPRDFKEYDLRLAAIEAKYSRK